MVDRVITRVGLRVVWHTSWYMYAVYSYAPVLVLAEANFLAFTLAAKWRFVLFTFVDLA